LAQYFRTHHRNLKNAIKKLISVGLITIKNNRLCIKGWKKRQFISDYSTSRSTANRRIKNDSKIGANATTLDAPTDNRYTDSIKKEKKQKKEKAKIWDEENFVRVWDEFDLKRGQPDAIKAWNKLKPSSELVGQILTAIRKEHAARQWHFDAGIKFPQQGYLQGWLNGRRWEDEFLTPEQYDEKYQRFGAKRQEQFNRSQTPAERMWNSIKPTKGQIFDHEEGG
jgi:hypothetical protein